MRTGLVQPGLHDRGPRPVHMSGPSPAWQTWSHLEGLWQRRRREVRQVQRGPPAMVSEHNPSLPHADSSRQRLWVWY